jgi:hypothetical protein
VFDRPKTIALTWAKDGTVTEWNPTFGAVMLDLDLGLGLELRWSTFPESITQIFRNPHMWVPGILACEFRKFWPLTRLALFSYPLHGPRSGATRGVMASSRRDDASSLGARPTTSTAAAGS